ncbi:MAG TPA: phytase [Roseiflexaceae bacterium]|nr:phytase [Roseiflexaceae bacterium]
MLGLHFARVLICALTLLLLSGCAGEPAPPARRAVTQVVVATIETEPMPHAGDSADDPAIWVDPDDPARSLIIGTDKLGGLALYDLSGAQLQYLPDGNLNNVDLRVGFALGGREVTLVTAGNRSGDRIAIYRLDPVARRLEDVAARPITTIEVYGSCMYRSATTGKLYYFINSKAGAVEQWELFDDGAGRVDGRKVRAFAVGSQTEGCVADDQLGRLYIAEEAVGIWRYGAEPGDGDARVSVDTAGAAGHLVSNIEGLALALGEDKGGYLIASSQGSSSYALYRRDDNAYVGSFAIGAGDGVDGVSDTDGIEVTAANLGPAFPHGVFVAQDGQNDDGNQNFKLVPLQAVVRLES